MAKKVRKRKPALSNVEKKILDKLSTLIMSAFGLVTALAWNDAIQTLLKSLFGKQSEIWAKFIYAIFLTAIVVIIGIQIDNILKSYKEKQKEKK